MPTPRKDYEHVRKTMGKRSAREFVKASGKSDALARKKKSPKKIDMKPYFEKQAEKGSNPFSMVTHINGKRIK